MVPSKTGAFLNSLLLPFCESIRSSFHVSFSQTDALPIRGSDVPSLRHSEEKYEVGQYLYLCRENLSTRHGEDATNTSANVYIQLNHRYNMIH